MTNDLLFIFKKLSNKKKIAFPTRALCTLVVLDSEIHIWASDYSRYIAVERLENKLEVDLLKYFIRVSDDTWVNPIYITYAEEDGPVLHLVLSNPSAPIGTPTISFSDFVFRYKNAQLVQEKL